jgi:hypothetical protein
MTIATERNNEIITKYIWNIFREHQSYLVETQKKLRDYDDLTTLFKDYIIMLSNKGRNSSVRVGLQTIGKATCRHLEKNCPKETEISDIKFLFEGDHDFLEFDYDKNDQWDVISDEYTSWFYSVLEVAILSKNQELFRETQYSYESFKDSVKRLDVGGKIKHVIILDAYLHSFSKAEDALKHRLFDDTNDTKVFRVESLNDDLDKEFGHFKRCMEITSAYILKQAENERLGSIFYRTINLGSIGRHCAAKYGSQPYDEAFYYIIDTIAKLKSIFEEKIDKNRNLYVKLHEETLSFKSWHQKKNPNPNQGLIFEIGQLLNSFYKVEDLLNKNNNTMVTWREIK